MLNKRYDIYIGCASKFNKKRESIQDFTKETMKNILSNIELHFSITSLVGGYPHDDGTYIVEDSFKITVIGDFLEDDVNIFIENMKEFFEQETLLLTVQELDMEYR